MVEPLVLGLAAILFLPVIHLFVCGVYMCECLLALPRIASCSAMMPAGRIMLVPVILLVLQAGLCHAACVEVDSDTEAVANEGFKMSCISCKMRSEVSATATVDWYFMAKGENEFTHIYSYEDEVGDITDERFYERLDWNGSKRTQDLQDGSLYILNVTFNDTGTYRCFFNRILTFTNYEFHTNATKIIHINVVARLTRGMASILSEVMMYVSIIGLQFWLLVEMIYCYRKIAASGEEALRESAAEYLAITAESKENCAGVQVSE